MYLIPIALVCLSCMGCGRGFVNESEMFRSVCILHILISPRSMKLSNEMKSPHNVFALLVVPWLLGLRNSSTIVTVEIQQARGIRNTSSSIRNFLIQTPSFAASEATIYSASVGHCLLLGTLPANRTTIYFEHETGLRL